MKQAKKNNSTIWIFIALMIGFVIPLAGFTTAGANKQGNQSNSTSPEAPPLNLSLSVYASGFDSPVSIANAEDERLFIVEQGGIIKIVDEIGIVLPTPFLNITSRVDSSSNEEGLLGLAFHPDYANNGYFYVNYTNTTGGTRRTRISRFQVTANPNIADPNSEDILLTVTQPDSNHNAGDIHFGLDGYFYIPLGDGGGGGDTNNNAQTLTTLLGKIARIDVDSGPGSAPDCSGIGSGNYTIPTSNPLDDGSGGTCDEIWAIGLRNPWRSSFDRLTGDFFIGDVGQGTWEEVDFQPNTSPGGENYGWRCYEGNDTYNTNGCGDISEYTFPVLQYDSTSSDCSVVGGYVYRGWRYPEMYGRYLLADYCTGSFWDLEPGPWAANKYNDLAPNNTTTLGEGMDGELYVASRSGTIYHIAEDTALTASIQMTKTVGLNPDVCATTDEINILPGSNVFYCYEVQNTGDITLTVHDLEDSQIGTLLSGFSFDLTPGSTIDTVAAGLTISDTIGETTTNTATWTASNPALFIELQETDTATVNVLPVNPSLLMTKTVGTSPGICADTDIIGVFTDTDVYYCYEVENTGDISFTVHSLVDDQLGTLLAGFPYDLIPGAKLDTVSAGLTISTTISDSTTNVGVWTGSFGPVNTTYTETAQVIVLPEPLNPAISLTKTVGTVPDECAPTNSITAFIGLLVHYCYEIENTGNITLTLHGLTDSQLGPILNDFPFTLGPGEKVNTVQAGLSVTAQITETTVNTATWTATLPGPAGVTASDSATATVTAIEPPFQLYLPTVPKEN